jgi:hypothetical protein
MINFSPYVFGQSRREGRKHERLEGKAQELNWNFFSSLIIRRGQKQKGKRKKEIESENGREKIPIPIPIQIVCI